MNDYNRPASFSILPEVVKNLLIINGLFFLARLTPLVSDFTDAYMPLFYIETPQFRVWQFITYMFMHADITHILFNMFGLWMFGSVLENLWGPKKFLTYYLLGGIGAALFHFAYTAFMIHVLNAVPSGLIILGASGAVYALLIAYGIMFPNNYIYLYFFVPIKAKYFVWLLIAFDLIGGLSGTGNVAHFAHIGGGITGAAILLFWKSKGRLYNNRTF